MEINLSQEFEKNLNKLQNDKNSDEIESYYKKESYKVSLINIDSSFRNINPKNLYTSSITYLEKDPLIFTKDSPFITINYKNHGLIVNDRIIVQNAECMSYILNGGIYLFNNFQYCLIKIKHNITTNYVNLLNNIQININTVDNLNIDNSKVFYDNIPINSLIGVFNIYLPSTINTISQNILDILNVKLATELDKDYVMIKLPFTYYSLELEYYEITDFFNFYFNDINGIPINGINADYPINYQRLQGYHQVYDVVNKNNFIIKTNFLALSSDNGGGDKIQIMKIINTEEGYPDANNYNVRLKKNFNNVVRIELISTEFPFIDYLIKNTGKYKNNKIYWKNFDDGNHIYSTELPEGNYDGTNLISLLTTYMNSIERITSTTENKVYNIFNIDYNSFTQEIVFTAFKIDNIPNSLKIDIILINNIKYFRLTIKHPNNLVDVNDIILLSNATAIGIIPASTLNTSHIVYEVNKTFGSYTVLLGTIIQLSTSSDFGTTMTSTGGGTITVKTKASFSLLFNYQDTIGSIIGFKNVGQNNAITPFKSKISNFDSYLYDTKLNTVGNLVETNLLLNLTGINNYYLLYINDFELVNNNSNLTPCFAKILLSGSPNDILYNTFINYPLEFDFPISTLNELLIKITYGDGKLPDFRNINHSFTLKITELVNYPRNTGLNSKNTNYIKTLSNLQKN